MERRMIKFRPLLIVAFLAVASMAMACEKNDQVVASEQLRESQNLCAAGCESPVPGCRIKGNISAAGNKFYHLPSEKIYKDIIIQPGKGERWFCTEAGAIANGWKKIPT
jgi:hypothetical protein